MVEEIKGKSPLRLTPIEISSVLCKLRKKIDEKWRRE